MHVVQYFKVKHSSLKKEANALLHLHATDQREGGRRREGWREKEREL